MSKIDVCEANLEREKTMHDQTKSALDRALARETKLRQAILEANRALEEIKIGIGEIASLKKVMGEHEVSMVPPQRNLDIHQRTEVELASVWERRGTLVNRGLRHIQEALKEN
jgi:hypothetical protein